MKSRGSSEWGLHTDTHCLQCAGAASESGKRCLAPCPPTGVLVLQGGYSHVGSCILGAALARQ
jgi:hypothetical protein